MKRTVTIALLLMITIGVHAQQTKICAAYWVVETNVNQKNFSIVRLYDTSNKLIHEVRMDGIYFDATRSRDRKMLNQLLKGRYERAEITASRIRKEKQSRRN